MRFPPTSRFLLLLLVLPVMTMASGCGSNVETQPEAKTAMQTQTSMRRIQNDPKLSPQAKQQMAAAMARSVPSSVKVEIQKQQADPEFQQVQNDPNLSPAEKQRVMEQSLANRQASVH